MIQTFSFLGTIEWSITNWMIILDVFSQGIRMTILIVGEEIIRVVKGDFPEASHAPNLMNVTEEALYANTLWRCPRA